MLKKRVTSLKQIEKRLFFIRRVQKVSQKGWGSDFWPGPPVGGPMEGILTVGGREEGREGGGEGGGEGGSGVRRKAEPSPRGEEKDKHENKNKSIEKKTKVLTNNQTY